MKAIKHLYPDSKTIFEIVHEIRTNPKTRESVDVYRVDWIDNYVCFTSLASALDFININFDL